MNERRSLVVILSALDVEYRAIRERLVTVHRLDSVAGTLFETGTLYAGGEVVLALTGAGNHRSAVIAERAISAFSPIAVFVAGVAGALNADLNLGDIVVATRVYAYRRAAARDAEPESRPRVWEIDHRIGAAAHDVARRFDQVRFGPIASGEALHDAQDSRQRRWISEHYDDALAIETEATGVAQAGRLSGTPVGIIRAISDRADATSEGASMHEIRGTTSHKGATMHGVGGTTSETDGAQGGTHGTSGVGGRRWQAEAARNAAGFAAALASELIGGRSSLDAGSRRDETAEAGKKPDLPAGEGSGWPAGKGPGLPVREGSGRSAGEGSGRAAGKGPGLPVREGSGRSAGEGSDLPAGEGSGRPAGDGPGLPARERSDRPARERPDLPARERPNQLKREQQDQAATGIHVEGWGGRRRAVAGTVNGDVRNEGRSS